ncbi:MAG: flavin reductase family protein [Chitinispirillaceae bacterium]|nr:flavin reductase family protein [Chitinispirillaceae bacterium]
MQRVDPMAIVPEVMERIRTGAFLTVQAGDRINVMTIGWAGFGFLWGRQVASIMVRKTRFTFGLIEKSSEFTVSVPQTDMSAALNFCGSRSGKRVDKFKACGLELFPGSKVKTPVIKLPGVHFECAIVYKSPVDPKHLVESYAHLYPEKDYHTIYYGEIKKSYSTVDEE